MLRTSYRVLVAVAITVGAVCASAPPALAATINVIACDTSSNADELDLIGAIEDANNSTTHPGSDTIELQAGCTYTFTSPVLSDPPRPALPLVTSSITIEGHGATLKATSGADDIDHLIWVEPTGTLKVRNVTMREANVAPVIGGSAIKSLGFLTIEDSVFEELDGIALKNGGQATVLRSTFRDNDLIALNGAAISSGGSLIVDDSRFERNVSSSGVDTGHSGGAIHIGEGGAGLILDSLFVDNFALDVGGAIVAFDDVSISGSTFTGNTAGFGGGAIWGWDDAVMTVTNTYLADNDTSGRAGALGATGTTIVTNSTFYSNQADTRGGAVYGQGPLHITSTTFASNTSSTNEGDAIYQASTTGVTKFSIFDGHSHACFTLRDGGGNIVDEFDPTCSGGFFLGDPKLESPALNGGKTKNMKLGAGSAALDRIASGCPSSDQRGRTRPAGPNCDIGAYEDQLPSAPGTPFISSGVNPTNGTFTLSWPASVDVDGPVTYRVFHKDANDATATLIGTQSATSRVISEAEGTYQYYVEAFEGGHAATSSSLTGVVVDRTAPAAPTATPDRSPDYVPASGTSWYLDTVTVTFTDNGDAALLDGSNGSGVASVTSPATINTSGTFSPNGTVTDAAGNTSASTSHTVHVDAENPLVSFSDCVATVLLNHATSVHWTASDASSGLATPASGVIALDVSSVGAKSVPAQATDLVGHSVTGVCNYNVIYDFTGFYDPVKNSPTVNTFPGGSGLAVSFSLAGNQGLAVIEAGYPQSVETPCNAFGEQTTGTATQAVKSLTFAPGRGGRYTYQWKTSTDWKGTCRQFILKLKDGTYHRANFNFT